MYIIPPSTVFADKAEVPTTFVALSRAMIGDPHAIENG